MPTHDPHPVKTSPCHPPISLKVRLLDRALRNLEWVGLPGEESCLVCGSGCKLDHAPGCPVAAALAPGTGQDALDGVIADAVFLTAAERYSVSVPLCEFVRKLEGMNAMVTRIQDLFPRV